MEKEEFENLQSTIDFYEDRYVQTDYMSQWPLDKKLRVQELLQDLDLPEIGRVLDFGCGTGVFTSVIKAALPNWEIFGCDLSQTAVDLAAKNNPDCTFFTHESGIPNNHFGNFDLLFSHHVLEHVYDIEQAWVDMNDYLSPNANILHILPCGNKKSFEDDYCLLIEGGIEVQMDNRYFFEDPGHVRRSSSEEMAKYAAVHGFNLSKAFFSNQYYGAIKWIIAEGPDFIDEFTDLSKAINNESRLKILKIRNKLIWIYRIRCWAGPTFGDHVGRMFSSFKSFFRGLLMIFFISPISRLVWSYYMMKAQNEWKYEKEKQNGSEMYLFFKRDGDRI